MLCSMFSLVIYFIHSMDSVYVSIPASQCIPRKRVNFYDISLAFSWWHLSLTTIYRIISNSTESPSLKYPLSRLVYVIQSLLDHGTAYPLNLDPFRSIFLNGTKRIFQKQEVEFLNSSISRKCWNLLIGWKALYEFIY